MFEGDKRWGNAMQDSRMRIHSGVTEKGEKGVGGGLFGGGWAEGLKRRTVAGVRYLQSTSDIANVPDSPEAFGFKCTNGTWRVEHLFANHT